MAFLNTTLRSGYITDLVLPPAKPGQDPNAILQEGLSAIYASIHDPKTMITLNPLVQDVKQIASSDSKAVDHQTLAPSFGVDLNAPYLAPSSTQDNSNAPSSSPYGFNHFEILDKLNLAFGFTQNLIYHAAIRPTRWGMEAFTNAGSGVTIFGRWEIKVADNGRVINIIEKNEIRCNVVVSWYINRTVDKSHAETHARLKAKWISDMKAKGYDYSVVGA